MLLEHKHLIVCAAIYHSPCNPSIIDDWMRQLVRDIRMKVLIGSFSVYSAMPGNQGLTNVTIIETFHITVHVWDEVSPALIQMDVYSCAEFDPQLIFDHLQSNFGLAKLEWKFIDREHVLDEIPLSRPTLFPVPSPLEAVT